MAVNWSVKITVKIQNILFEKISPKDSIFDVFVFLWPLSISFPSGNWFTSDGLSIKNLFEAVEQKIRTNKPKIKYAPRQEKVEIRNTATGGIITPEKDKG